MGRYTMPRPKGLKTAEDYWICDPQERRTHVYRFRENSTPTVPPFDEPVGSSMLPGLAVDFAAILAGM